MCRRCATRKSDGSPHELAGQAAAHAIEKGLALRQAADQVLEVAIEHRGQRRLGLALRQPEHAAVEDRLVGGLIEAQPPSEDPHELRKARRRGVGEADLARQKVDAAAQPPRQKQRAEQELALVPRQRLAVGRPGVAEARGAALPFALALDDQIEARALHQDPQVAHDALVGLADGGAAARREAQAAEVAGLGALAQVQAEVLVKDRRWLAWGQVM
jgi:hypothetical protein